MFPCFLQNQRSWCLGGGAGEPQGKGMGDGEAVHPGRKAREGPAVTWWTGSREGTFITEEQNFWPKKGKKRDGTTVRGLSSGNLQQEGSREKMSFTDFLDRRQARFVVLGTKTVPADAHPTFSTCLPTPALNPPAHFPSLSLAKPSSSLEEVRFTLKSLIPLLVWPARENTCKSFVGEVIWSFRWWRGEKEISDTPCPSLKNQLMVFSHFLFFGKFNKIIFLKSRKRDGGGAR